MKVLVAQMKPHFIFNALTKIKSMYHTNLQEGDSTLELFSDYMRESLSLLDNEIVSFETELQNLARYVDFINTGRKTLQRHLQRGRYRFLPSRLFSATVY